VKAQQIQNVKPASRVGGTIGMQIPAMPAQNGIGVNLFFHQTISHSWFLSSDAGYHYNPYTETQNGVKDETYMSSVPITLEINAFLFHSSIHPYLGLGLSMLNRSWDYVEYLILNLKGKVC
jgi:hypothetical protein